jgi:hypothetical protein
VQASENERDLSLKAELFVARTGAPAAVFNTYRTGPGRLRNAARGIVDQCTAALPFRSRLVIRKQARGLISKGRADGVKEDAVYDVVKKGRAQTANEGIALIYAPEDLTGTITITSVDDEIAVGTLARRGFFDRIEPGDEIILAAEQDGKTPAAEIAANPELRALLRTLR